jgi:hypothetical protein
VGDRELSVEPIFETFGKVENPQSLWQGKTLESVAYAPMHLIMERFMFLVHDMHD